MCSHRSTDERVDSSCEPLGAGDDDDDDESSPRVYCLTDPDERQELGEELIKHAQGRRCNDGSRWPTSWSVSPLQALQAKCRALEVAHGRTAVGLCAAKMEVEAALDANEREWKCQLEALRTKVEGLRATLRNRCLAEQIASDAMDHLVVAEEVRAPAGVHTTVVEHAMRRSPPLGSEGQDEPVNNHNHGDNDHGEVRLEKVDVRDQSVHEQQPHFKEEGRVQAQEAERQIVWRDDAVGGPPAPGHIERAGRRIESLAHNGTKPGSQCRQRSDPGVVADRFMATATVPGRFLAKPGLADRLSATTLAPEGLPPSNFFRMGQSQSDGTAPAIVVRPLSESQSLRSFTQERPDARLLEEHVVSMRSRWAHRDLLRDMAISAGSTAEARSHDTGCGNTTSPEALAGGEHSSNNCEAVGLPVVRVDRPGLSPETVLAERMEVLCRAIDARNTSSN